MANQPQHILVRAPNWLGDLVMSTPGFRALREGLPDAKLHLQVRSHLAPLLDGSPWFDRIHPLPDADRRGLRGWRHGRALARRYRFDRGLLIPDSFSAAAIMRGAGVRRIVGYRRGGRGFLLHRPVSRPSSWGRRTWVAREQFVLDLVKQMGCEPRGTHLELFTTESEEERAERVLREDGSFSSQPFFVLAPGSSFGPSKCWPVARFAKLGDALVGNGAKVVIVGSGQERALATELQGAMRAPAQNLAGALDLGAMKAVVRRAKALVCNDAGARHVAVAFGIPCVVLLGPTSLRKTGMNLEQVRVLSAEMACRPCYQRVCPIDHRCMTWLGTDDVLEALADVSISPRPGLAEVS